MPIRSLACFYTAVVGLACPRLLTAQLMQGSAVSIREFARVRVTAPALRPQRWIGMFSRIQNDSLFFHAEPRRDSLTFLLTSLSRVEVSAGMSQRSRTESVLWGVAGLVGGVLVGRAVARANVESSTGCDTFDFFGCNEEGWAADISGLVVGAAGATIGYHMGRRPRESWRRVY